VSSTADPGSCSACASRSAATQSGLALSSATITTSLGPATESMPTCPNSWRLASATNALPGPITLFTARIDCVPQASAAIATAPPSCSTSRTPSSPASASAMSLTRPPLGGVAMTISRTPATCAGTTVISTLDGYSARPPGTYTPTRSIGV
jgi:hypothetical protein